MRNCYRQLMDSKSSQHWSPSNCNLRYTLLDNLPNVTWPKNIWRVADQQILAAAAYMARRDFMWVRF